MHATDTSITIAFYDLDPMGIVWHGNYAKYFEIARSNLLEKIGYNYVQMQDSGYLFPIVDMQIKYVRPLRLAQEFIVTARIIEYQNRLKIDYKIRDKNSGEILTKATTIQVALKNDSGELCLECPAELVEKVQKVKNL